MIHIGKAIHRRSQNLISALGDLGIIRESVFIIRGMLFNLERRLYRGLKKLAQHFLTISFFLVITASYQCPSIAYCKRKVIGFKINLIHSIEGFKIIYKDISSYTVFSLLGFF